MLTGMLQLFAASCGNPSFFSFPTWYKYLPGSCDKLLTGTFKEQVPQLGLIALALVDIMLRVGGLVAVGFVIWGGIQFITAQGDPGQNKKARQTVINALIGLTISLISVGVVHFIGSKVG